ncbi:AAA family ATPase [Nodosilinea sp. LEGE 06152]|uniref:ParA family partition ATPase n=1 Tax=Nodosilinea sp. LEGE 06152 TaxID=2777966 RepID=UPI0018803516|nr:ParA family partition ATPase [Nodosilinea sp. LEGE 06152]MBE9160657.1 AAA family ATPase [Nodosilinea sp. LEGE 06152]
MIITIASLKGGSGKTSLSVHLAHAIALAGRKVLLVDADPQASASTWASARDDKPPFSVVGMARDTLHRELPDLVANYDHTLIDTPPRTSKLTGSAIVSSDLVLIPVQPSSYDVWAAAETVAMVEQVQGIKPDLLAAFIVNRAIGRTVIARDILDALEDYPFPVLSTTIAQRVAIAESSGGHTVFEVEPSGAAARDFRALAKDVLKLTGVEQW